MAAVALTAVLAAGCGSSSPASGPDGAAAGTAPPATAAPEPEGPRLELSASTDLADRQEVEVSGSGFRPRADLTLALCGPDRGPVVEGCQAVVDPARGPAGWYTTPDADGRVRAVVPVRSTLYTDQQLVDCVPGGCRLAVFAFGSSADPLVAEVPLTFDPAAAGELDQPPPPGGCPAPHAPFASRRWVSGDPGGFSPAELTPEGVEGEEVVYPAAGAAVRVVAEDGAVRFEVVIDGVVRTFTTAPDELGGHYPNRVQGIPGETAHGTFSVVEEPDGTRDVVLRRAASGDYSAYAWSFDDPCGAGPP